MFSVIVEHYIDDNRYIEAVCLAADVDTMPTDGIANGSVCKVMDNGKTYMFDEEGSNWVEFAAPAPAET